MIKLKLQAVLITDELTKEIVKDIKFRIDYFKTT